MAENIELARFGIDMDRVTSDAVKLKDNLNALKSQLKELKEAEGDTTAEQVKLEASIKAVNSQYNANIRVLQQTVEVTAGVTSQEDKMTEALNTQATSIAGLREQNKILNQLRNEMDIDTQAEEIQKLNDKLNANNETIKANIDNLSQQKMNVGNYTASIQEAISGIEAFGIKLPASFRNAASATSTMGASFGTLGQSLKGATIAMGGLIKSSIAFMLTPIGAVISTLAVAFLAINTAMNRSEASMNKLTSAFAPFTGILDVLMEALSDLGEIYIDYVVFQLELLEKTVFAVLGGVQKALNFLGFDQSAEAIGDWIDRVEEGAQASRELAQAEQDLTQMMRDNTVVASELKAKSSELKQIRDDDTKSLAVRLKASRDVMNVENSMINQQIEIAQKQLEITRAKIQLQGASTDLLDKEAQLLATINGLNSESNNLQTDSIKNENALIKEINTNRQADLDKQKQAIQAGIDAKIKALNEELELDKQRLGWRAKTLEQELKDAEDIAKKQIKILDFELANKRISQTKYNTEKLKIEQEQAQLLAEIAIENAELELELFLQTQNEIQAQNKYLTDERLNELRESNQAIFDERQRFEEERLAQGLINETEFNKAMRENMIALEEENLALEKEREENRLIEEQALRAIEFENMLEQMREDNATQYELERELAEEKYSNDLQMLNDSLANQLISQEEYNLQSLLLENGLKDARLKIAEEENNMKLNLTKGLMSAIGNVINKNSVAGKAIAVAQAGINMFQGITADLKLDWPLSIPAIAMDTATGLSAIKNIISTKIPSATGSGNVGGGGSMPSGITSTGFGSIPSGSDATVLNQLDANGMGDMMAEQVGEAVAQGARQGTQNGMIELTENRAIANSSTY